MPDLWHALPKRKEGELAQLLEGFVSRVQLSPYRVQLAGTETAELIHRPLVKEVRTVGFVTFDKSKLSRLVVRVSGYLEIEMLEKPLVPPSEKTCTLSINAYRVGRISFEQLIESYRELMQYRIDLYARQSRREQALASLERTVGCAITILPMQLEEVPTVSPLPGPN